MISFSRPGGWRSLEGCCHEVGHTWSSSCVYSWLEMGAFLAFEGMKIYLPLRVLSDISRGNLLKNLKNGSTFKDVLQSSLFLGANGGLLVCAICTIRRLLGRFYLYSVGFLPGVVSTGCAILVEKKSRRGLLAGYTSMVALEFLFSLLKNHGVITPLPYGDVLLFSLASSFIFYQYKTQPALRDIISSMIRVLMSPYVPGPIVRSLQSSVLDHRWTRILLVGAWAFLLGYLLQCLLSLLGQGSKLLKRRGTLGRLYHVVVNSRNVRFGAFLGSFSAGFLALKALLWYLPLPRPLRLLLAGFVAGLSMIFVRSKSISLYVAWKSLETLFFAGVRRGYFRSYYYADVLIYALSTATIYHAAFFHGHHMRSSYWSFLMSGTHGRLSQLNYDLIDRFGTEASTRPKQELAKAQLRVVTLAREMAAEMEGRRKAWEAADAKQSEPQGRHSEPEGRHSEPEDRHSELKSRHSELEARQIAEEAA